MTVNRIDPFFRALDEAHEEAERAVAYSQLPAPSLNANLAFGMERPVVARPSEESSDKGAALAYAMTAVFSGAFGMVLGYLLSGVTR